MSHLSIGAVERIEAEKRRWLSFHRSTYRRASVAGMDEILHPDWRGACPYTNPKTVRIWVEGVKTGREIATALIADPNPQPKGGETNG